MIIYSQTAAELTYQILYYVNYVCIAFTTIGFLFQLIYIGFCFLKPKRFKPSEKKAKIAVFIAAKDEEDVIKRTVSTILSKQDYPKDKYQVFVVADNCSDKTYEFAKQAGAEVYVHNDPDPKTHKVAYAMKFGINKILEEHPGEFDFLIRFDADNIPADNYLSKMNDAYQSGVEIARPYEASSNLAQNSWTKVSGTYYMRDSRLASNFRERAHLDSMLTGAGMMISMKVLSECGDWDAMGSSEDAEFTINRLLEKKRVHYVAEAIVYEDQPSSLKDTFHRLTRMGHGLHSLFWRKGFPLFGHFFVSGRWSNVDLFFQLFFIPVSVLCCLWFPAYYIYFAIGHLMNAFGNNWISYISPADSQGQLIELIYLVVTILSIFYIVYALQTFLAVKLSQKDLGIKSLKGYWGGIFWSPVFMVFYGLAITIGVFTKPKWRHIARNIDPQ